MIAEYLNRYRNESTVTRQSVAAGFSDMRESVPSNLPRDFAWAVKVGWLAPKDRDGELFYVTKSGTDAVNRKFPDEIRARTKQTSAGRRRKKKTGEDT